MLTFTRSHLVRDLNLLSARQTLCIFDRTTRATIIMLDQASTRKEATSRAKRMSQRGLPFLRAAGHGTDSVLARRRQITRLIQDILDALLFFTNELATSTARLRDEAPVVPTCLIALYAQTIMLLVTDGVDRPITSIVKARGATSPRGRCRSTAAGGLDVVEGMGIEAAVQSLS